jgi:hypothetical protein
MSNWGSNSFVIESANSTEMYEKIMKSFDLCVELDTQYEICRANGKVYTIEKSEYEYSESGVHYIFTVWDSNDYDNKVFHRPLAYSFIEPRMLELKDGNLHISESWCNSGGVLRYYIADTKLYETANIYFSTSCESDIVGATNDKKGKYFKVDCCIYDGDIETVKSMIASNYFELPLDEQIAICKSLEAQGIDICYAVVSLIETEKFFG